MGEHEVHIGDRSVTIDSLSGFKVLRAGKMLARITKSVSGVSEEIQKFVADYRTTNTETISRALFEYRLETENAAALQLAREQIREESPEMPEEHIEAEAEKRVGPKVTISDAAWKESGNEMKMTRNPSGMEVGAFILPQVMESAEAEVAQLLALVIAPDRELRDAKKDGNYDQYLADKGEELLFDAQIDELVEIAAVTAEVLRDKLAGKLSRLQGAVGRLMGTEEPVEDGTSSNSTSSTPSPPHTDGGPTKSSSPVGTTSTVSSSA